MWLIMGLFGFGWPEMLEMPGLWRENATMELLCAVCEHICSRSCSRAHTHVITIETTLGVEDGFCCHLRLFWLDPLYFQCIPLFFLLLYNSPGLTHKEKCSQEFYHSTLIIKPL